MLLASTAAFSQEPSPNAPGNLEPWVEKALQYVLRGAPR
jgi:hypothetical protein